MNIGSVAMQAAALCAVAACTSVSVSSFEGGAVGDYRLSPNKDVFLNSAKVRGLVYSLPYTILLIEGGHCLGDDPKPAGKGAAAADAATTNITITNAPTTSATATAGEKTPPKPGETPAQSVAKKTCEQAPEESDYRVRVTPLVLADRSQTYQAVFDLSGFSSDTHKLTINESGLLSSSNSTSKDETREAVVAFAKSAAAILAGGLNFGEQELKQFWSANKLIQRGPEISKPKSIQSFRMYCDVSKVTASCSKVFAAVGDQAGISVKTKFDASESDGAWRALPAESTLTGDARDANPSCPPIPTGVEPDRATQCPGLLFRMRRDHLVEVTVTPDAASGFGATTTTVVTPIIDPGRIYSVTPVRRSFVKTKTDLTFDRGVLTTIDGDYPSTGGAILSLPADFITAVFGGIRDILTVRIETVEKQGELEAAVAANAAAAAEAQAEASTPE